MSFRIYEDLHHILSRLPKWKSPRDPGLNIPENGLYIHYQSGETFKDSSGKRLPRIVRVGSHTGAGRLEKRLASHYDPKPSFVSSFSNQVRTALINRYAIPEWISLSDDAWSAKVEGHYSDDYWLEKTKSYLLKKFRFSVLQLPDLEECDKWEKKLIITLAPYSYYFASGTWLGFHHRSKIEDKRAFSRIRKFGLWNIQGTSPASFPDEICKGQLTELEGMVAKSMD